MIKFENWRITCDGLLAYQYDNLSRRIEIVGNLPEGWTWELLVQVEDALDVITLTPMGGGVGHTLTAEQVSIPGYYTVQLRGRMGEVVKHTNPVQTFVSKSLSGDAKWPELPSEFSQAEARIAELNAHPPKPGENGYWMLWDAEKDEYITSGIPLPAGAGGGGSANAVLFTPQELDEQQREQARTNIDAAPKMLIVWLERSEGELRADHSALNILTHIANGGYATAYAPFADNAVGLVSEIANGHVVFLFHIKDAACFAAKLTVDSDYVETWEVSGPEGPQGEQGPAGEDGYTPVKGVDYWTAADKQEIVDDVLAALPAAEGVGF